MTMAKDLFGIMKTLVALTKEEFNDMDHKLPRLAMGVASFAAAALFWFYFMRHIVPF